MRQNIWVFGLCLALILLAGPAEAQTHSQRRCRSGCRNCLAAIDKLNGQTNLAPVRNDGAPKNISAINQKNISGGTPALLLRFVPPQVITLLALREFRISRSLTLKFIPLCAGAAKRRWPFCQADVAAIRRRAEPRAEKPKTGRQAVAGATPPLMRMIGRALCIRCLPGDGDKIVNGRCSGGEAPLADRGGAARGLNS